MVQDIIWGDGRTCSTSHILEWEDQSLPHIIMVTQHYLVGDERLLYGEVSQIVEAMDIRLHQEEFKKRGIAPVSKLYYHISGENKTKSPFR